MKRIFEVDDGETHWYVGEDADAVRAYHIENCGVEAGDVAGVAALEDAAILTLGLSSWDLDFDFPTPLYQDLDGNWLCSATARQWADHFPVHECIGSTIY